MKVIITDQDRENTYTITEDNINDLHIEQEQTYGGWVVVFKNAVLGFYDSSLDAANELCRALTGNVREYQMSGYSNGGFAGW
jgi:hypothetical protein